jgi:general secretion pathway protein K
MSRPIPRREQGAALINVLVLVGVLSALSTTLFDRMRLARHLDAARTLQDAARAGALAAETLLLARAAGPLPSAPLKLATPAGPATAALAPGGNCFNLNSVAMGLPGRTITRPLGVEQLTRLLGLLEVPQDDARRIAAATADWIDVDSQPGPGGAEDPAYVRAAVPYRTGATLLADVSEWRAVAGVTPAIYARARPHLCALPEAELSRPNINSLLAADAPVLAAIAGLDVATARAAITARPPGGWASATDFWGQPLLSGRNVAADVLRQPDTRDRFIAFRLAAGTGDLPFIETGLIAAGAPERPARLLLRRWGEAE